MPKNIEIESKTLLKKSVYEKIYTSFKIKSEFNQKNYYFDNNNHDLINNFSSVRIRCFEKHAEQTLKSKENNPIQKKYHEVIEINDPLELSQAQKMISNATQKKTINFNGKVGNFLSENFDSNITNKLYLTTWSQTHRTLLNGPDNCELTLDKTSYADGFIDFELEIENDDTQLIKSVIESLKKQFLFSSTIENTSKNKIIRAYQHSR